jgi:hypothetical protein
MRKITFSFITIVLLFLACNVSQQINAEVPKLEEQFIYSLTSFNGRGYSHTFAGEESEKIYILADGESIISPRKTFVYYWPITDELMTEPSLLDIELSGVLVVDTPSGPFEYNLDTYTFYNNAGNFEQNWQISLGHEAEEVWENYKQLQRQFQELNINFQREAEAYEKRANELMERGLSLRSEGKDTSEIIALLKSLKAPEIPDNPITRVYQVPPAEPKMGFVINLDPGTYPIYFLAGDGKIMEGSQKELVVFSTEREDMIGIEVIPENKWNRPTASRTPSSVIYVDGSEALFLRPFTQKEFNNQHYARLRQNDSEGNPNFMSLYKMQYIPGAKISMTSKEGKSELLEEGGFYVEQEPGPQLGYSIIPVGDSGDLTEKRDPDMTAHHFQLEGEQRSYHFEVFDTDGNPLPTGRREVRVITAASTAYPVYLLALLPGIPPLLLVIRKRKKTI